MHEISLYKKLIIFVIINKNAFNKSTAFKNIPEMFDRSTLWNEMEKIKPDLFNVEFDPDVFDIALNELVKDKILKNKLTLEESAFGRDLADNFWITKDKIKALKKIYNYDKYKRTNRFD